MEHEFGRIEVLTGTMGSGKSEELVRRVKRAVIAKQKVQAFYPDIAERREPFTINTFDGKTFPAQPFSNKDPESLLGMVDLDTKVVGIDEAQFVPEELLDVCRTLRKRGVRVIVTGLDMNFKGDPFGVSMPALMAICDDVSKLHAICMKCGDEANVPQRLILGPKDLYYPAPADSDEVAIGEVADKESGGNGSGEKKKPGIIYEPRCWNCHELPIGHLLHV